MRGNGTGALKDANERLRAGTLPLDPMAESDLMAGAEAEGGSRSNLPTYPVEVLPPLTRYCVEAIAGATGAPIELAVLPALAVAATAAGPGWRVAAGSYESSPANWFGAVAAPGAGKTPTAKYALRPLWEADRRLREEFELRHEEWARASRGKAPSDPGPEPVRRSLIVTDVTPEALAVELALAEGHGILQHSDELASMLEGMDAYRARGKKGRKSYLSAWSSEPIRIRRRGGESIEVDSPCLVVYGGVQPDVLSKLDLRDGDGLTARFLWALAPVRQHGLGQKPPEKATSGWRGIVTGLLGVSGAAVQELTPEASRKVDEHIQWSSETAGRLSDDGLGLLAALTAKSPEHLMRLTALLHALDAAEAALGTPEPVRGGAVPLSTVRRAARLVNYHLAHGRRVVELVLRRQEAEQEGELLEQDAALVKALALLVPAGSSRSNPAGAWVELLEAAGHEVKGKSRATTLGKAFRRLEASPSPPVWVRKDLRARDRGWTVGHDR